MDWLTTPSQRNIIVNCSPHAMSWIFQIFWISLKYQLLGIMFGRYFCHDDDDDEAPKCFQTTSVLRKWVSCLSCVYCQWLWLPRFVPDLSNTNWLSSVFHCISTISKFNSCCQSTWPLNSIASFSVKVFVFSDLGWVIHLGYYVSIGGPPVCICIISLSI